MCRAVAVFTSRGRRRSETRTPKAASSPSARRSCRGGPAGRVVSGTAAVRSPFRSRRKGTMHVHLASKEAAACWSSYCGLESVRSKLDPFKAEIHRLLGVDAAMTGQRVLEPIAHRATARARRSSMTTCARSGRCSPRRARIQPHRQRRDRSPAGATSVDGAETGTCTTATPFRLDRRARGALASRLSTPPSQPRGGE